MKQFTMPEGGPSSLWLPGQDRDEVASLATKPLFFANGRLRRQVAGGAFASTSGLYVANWKKPHDGTDTIIDWVNDSIKAALYTNSIATMSYSTDTVYASAPYTSNEIANGSGYTTAGVALGTKTCTESPTGTIMFDAADAAWTSSTFSAVRGTVIHNVTLTLLLLAVTFGADYAVSAGTFTIQWPSTGVFYKDITP